MSENLFIGVYPAGLVYADRSKELHGDYARVAFLPYDTLELRIDAPRSELLPEVLKDAATLQAKSGELYEVSACGQTVLLGSAKPKPEAATMNVAEYRNMLDGLGDAISSWKSCASPAEFEREAAALERWRRRLAFTVPPKRLKPHDRERYLATMAEAVDILNRQAIKAAT